MAEALSFMLTAVMVSIRKKLGCSVLNYYALFNNN